MVAWDDDKGAMTMKTDMITASRFETAAPLTQLTDDEIVAVGGGASLMGLPAGVILLGRLIAAALLN
jgi:hypothetical protein